MADVLAVCAIDFGTTFSGVAVQVREKDQKTQEYRDFVVGRSQIEEMKYRLEWEWGQTENDICINSGKNVFGTASFEEFKKLAKRKNKEAKLFHSFKMSLYDEKTGMLKHPLRVKDHTGKTHEPEVPFVPAIYELKEVALSLLPPEIRERPGQIRWILTVPAIWDQASRQVMCKWAVAAGIPEPQLSLALEPEAASLYIKKTLNPEPKTVYLLLDAGGGTVDFVVHRVLEDGCVEEARPPFGNDGGSTQIDRAFEAMIVKIFTKRVCDQIPPVEWIGMVKYFRKQKIFWKGGEASVVLPRRLKATVEKVLGESVETVVSKYDEELCFDEDDDTLLIPHRLWEKFFAVAIDKTINLLNQKAMELRAAKITACYVVGGFGSSPILKSALEAYFAKPGPLQGIKVVVISKPHQAVLFGAVLHGVATRPGKEDDRVKSRLAPCSYAILTAPPYDPIAHAKGEKSVINGKEVCSNFLERMISQNQRVLDTEIIAKSYIPVDPKATRATIKVYSWPSAGLVEFATRSGQAKEIGVIHLDWSNDGGGDGKAREIIVGFSFGATQVKVTANEKVSGQECRCEIDFNASKRVVAGAPARKPYHIIFVVDRSWSMCSSDCVPDDPIIASKLPKNRLGAVYQSVYRFMNKRDKIPLEKYSMIAFDSGSFRVFERKSQGTDKLLLLDLMAKTEPDGGTSFRNAIRACIDLLKESTPVSSLKMGELSLKDSTASDGKLPLSPAQLRQANVPLRPVIFFLSDGEASAPISEMKELMSVDPELKVWTVKFSKDPGGVDPLKKIAEMGNGSFKEALDPAALDEVLEQFAIQVLK